MFTDPVKNLKQFGLRENMIVADLGAGTGFYSIAAAQMVPMGKVYAIEIQKDYLTTIKDKTEEAHLNNIECLLGNVEQKGGTKLKDGIVDAVIASNIFFQIENKEKFIEEIKRILKPDGKLLLIDWLDGLPLVGVDSMKILSKDNVCEMFINRGFIVDGEINTGAHHYGIILRKKK